MAYESNIAMDDSNNASYSAHSTIFLNDNFTYPFEECVGSKNKVTPRVTYTERKKAVSKLIALTAQISNLFASETYLMIIHSI